MTMTSATRDDRSVMSIRILGPFEASRGVMSLVPSAAKPRQILAMLALNVGHVVTVPDLMEELWGTRPPRSALTTLQTYIMTLRRGFDAAFAGDESRGAKDILATSYGGYLLDIPAQDIDVYSYERLVASGRRALDLGDDEGASRCFSAALDLWRGQVLVDVRLGTRLEIEVIRLQEGRLAAVESRIEAELRLGRHRGLLGELAMLVARHPMNENLCEHYMVALYRSGRQSHALAAFTRMRNTLVRELGVEPSARIKYLQRAILAADSMLDLRSAA